MTERKGVYLHVDSTGTTEELIREAMENEIDALRGALNKLAADRHRLIDEVDALKVERDDFKHRHIMLQAENKAMKEALIEVYPYIGVLVTYDHCVKLRECVDNALPEGDI